MEIAALLVAVLALVVAIAARGKAAKAEARIDEAASAAGRRAEAVVEEVERRFEGERRLLAKVASGAKLSQEQILEGRLWRDASGGEALALVKSGARILDVRTPQETASGVIPGAILIPVQELEARAKELPKDGRTTLVYCAGGSRSAAACEMLANLGHDDLVNLADGFQSWSGPRAKA